MYAVIKTGGKQYKVAEGDIVNVEKLEGAKGDAVSLDEILLISQDDHVKVGAPIVEGAKVVGTILTQIKGPKITIFKKKRRKGFRKKTGHRQQLTSLKITEISA
ncbi:MAG: 50S ribosomal protein L21 [Deltaproteobacteria bacterium]|nr:50S ribosomal protein L21 [Deltaproteobacteria bacterium]